MIINRAFLLDAVKRCAPAVDAGVGLVQERMVLFTHGYVMGCGTTINIRVPCKDIDDTFMVDKVALLSALDTTTDNVEITREDAKVKIKRGRSRVTLPCADLPLNLPQFPDIFLTAPNNFLSSIRAASFTNKSAYAGVALDARYFSGAMSTDSIRIVMAACNGIDLAAWLPPTAVDALLHSGKTCTGVYTDMPYLHLQYEDGTVCSVLYRSADDYPGKALAPYLHKVADDTSDFGTLSDDILAAIAEASAFTNPFANQALVQLEFLTGSIRVSAANASGEYVAEVEWDGPSFGIFSVDSRPFKSVVPGSSLRVCLYDDGDILHIMSGDVQLLLSPDS